MVVRAELQAQVKHLSQVMKAGLPPLWATIAFAVVLIGGSVWALLAWGLRHWPLALAGLLAVLLFVCVEGSYQVVRQVEKDHADRNLPAAAPSRDGRSPERRRLDECLSEGKVLQARITGEYSQGLLPLGLREEVAAWEAKAVAVLSRKPGWLRDFDIPPPRDPFTVTANAAHGRISAQLRVLQAATNAW